VPDRIVFLNEKAHLVELKTATGVLSPRQIHVFDELGEAGFPVYVIRSHDDIQEFIREAMQ
jgi:putative heme degradation protein